MVEHERTVLKLIVRRHCEIRQNRRGIKMKVENGTVMSSYVAGIALVLIGAFLEPLLMVLGVLIIISGVLACVVESHRRKYQAMEFEVPVNSEPEPKQITA